MINYTRREEKMLHLFHLLFLTVKNKTIFVHYPSNIIEFLGISFQCFNKFELFCHLWYDSYRRRTCCILGGYALM